MRVPGEFSGSKSGDFETPSKPGQSPWETGTVSLFVQPFDACQLVAQAEQHGVMLFVVRIPKALESRYAGFWAVGVPFHLADLLESLLGPFAGSVGGMREG